MRDASVTDINIPFAESGPQELRLSVGACRLRVGPGGDAPWVLGSYRDPSGKLPCRISQEGGAVRISQEHKWADALSGLGNLPASFELEIGKANPFAFALETGASEADLDLGGVPVNRMSVGQGAGKIAIAFSSPNPTTMETLTLNNGASSTEMRDLANANFVEMRADGGAGAYLFDFGGTLQQNARARITAGVCAVEIRVPATTAAKITVEPVLGGLDLGDGFMKKEGAFWTEAALTGSAPVLTMEVKIALGSVKLRTA